MPLETLTVAMLAKEAVILQTMEVIFVNQIVILILGRRGDRPSIKNVSRFRSFRLGNE